MAGSPRDDIVIGNKYFRIVAGFGESLFGSHAIAINVIASHRNSLWHHNKVWWSANQCDVGSGGRQFGKNDEENAIGSKIEPRRNNGHGQANPSQGVAFAEALHQDREEREEYPATEHPRDPARRPQR